ncbi:hypothetical protein BD413DRAFT_681146, partial [Trametes elegans]
MTTTVNSSSYCTRPVSIPNEGSGLRRWIGQDRLASLLELSGWEVDSAHSRLTPSVKHIAATPALSIEETHVPAPSEGAEVADAQDSYCRIPVPTYEPSLYAAATSISDSTKRHQDVGPSEVSKEVARNKEATALMKGTTLKSIIPSPKSRENSNCVRNAVTPNHSPNATIATARQEVPEKGPWKGPGPSRLRLSYCEDDDNFSDDDGPAADPRRTSCDPDTKQTRKHKQRRSLECVVSMYRWRLKE